MKNMNTFTSGRSHGNDMPVLSRGGEFNHLMNYLWNYLDTSNSSTESSSLGEWEPHIQIAESKEAVNITAELPGINEEDLDLQISSDGYLSLCGEKKNSCVSGDKDAYFSEISYGAFKRTIPLPWDLDYDNAVANYKNGVLSISIPKTPVEKQKFKKISIQKNTN